MTENIALVGFSINSEISYAFDARNTLEKAPLKSVRADIGGTSANVATAIQTLGGKSKLLALKGEGNDFETHTLEYVLQNCNIPYTNYPILEKSHFAILPDDEIQAKKVLGKKGKIIKEKLPETLAKIEKEIGKWRIGTGVRVEEVDLVMCLFNKHVGFRSLNPRMELIKNGPIFHELLKSTDLLICNMAEYEACRVTSPYDLHEYGPSLVIVTNGENDGMFSHKNTGAKTFSACGNYIKPETKLYNTGIGDWFNGSFTAKCMEVDKAYRDLTLEEIQKFISFAARVAGKKITMEGPNNGPSLLDL